MKKSVTSLLFIICFVLYSYSQKEIIINNLKPRIDVNEDTIDLHDGRVIKFGDRFYWYGTSYGNTTGFVRTNRYHCYSSPDLMSWKKEGPLLVNEPSGIYYRPHVIYNPKTKKYVLWYNWYPKLWKGQFGVAVSNSPSGPFKIVNSDVKVAHSQLGVGDFGLFVDDDQTAYLVYNTIQGHQNSVEKLNCDFLSSSLINGGFIAQNCEAGAIFKRKNLYYLLTDYTCCFCTQGSGARVYVSDNPLTGYVLKNNINRYPGTFAPTLIDGIKQPNLYETLQRNENGNFPEVEIGFPETTINQLKIYSFTGNRSGMCGDTLASRVHDKIVPPDFKIFAKKSNEWNEIPASVNIIKSSIFNVIVFNFDGLNSGAVKISASPEFPYNNIYLAEIELFGNPSQISGITKGAEAFILNNIQKPVIPAQQTFVMPLETTKGTEFIWMGDLWGSAPDDIKGHDYQYWGAPLEFDENGNIKRMNWVNEWKVTLKN